MLVHSQALDRPHAPRSKANPDGPHTLRGSFLLLPEMCSSRASFRVSRLTSVSGGSATGPRLKMT